MGQLLKQTTMSSQRSTPETFAEIVEAFLVYLADIPTERLADCFRRARENRRTLSERDRTFPLTADDVGAAWYQLGEEEKARLRRLDALHCTQCNDTRKLRVYLPKEDREVEIDCDMPVHKYQYDEDGHLVM